MRFWHKDLIRVLPTGQLLKQWDDCCSVKKVKGSTSKKVLSYPEWNLINYTSRVYQEILRRGYQIEEKDFEWKECESDGKKLFEGWHNRRYLTQCYYNLQEKYDCGIITSAEWALIESRYRRLIDDDKGIS